LWTLSFEFQFYVLLPLIFAAFRRFSGSQIVLAAAGICFLTAIARLALFDTGLSYPAIYVTPLFRPEAIVGGLLLAAYQPRFHVGWSAAVGLCAMLSGAILPLPWDSKLSALLTYPLVALGWAALLDVVLRSKARAAFAHPAIAYLGTISFGIYVFHFGVRHALQLAQPQLPLLDTPIIFATVMFAGSVGLAMLSYRFIETPFLRRKRALHENALALRTG
jgi:peptidoglycan/LPS O-acetylase OafA/YrhL